jgi:Substrate binding domain of ABC-type glycine betaine transport system
MSRHPGGQVPGYRRHTRTALLATLAAAALLLAACSSSSSGTSGGGTSSPSSAPAVGAGKSLTLGTKDFTEEFIIGALYQQALQAKGYKITYKPNIGATEVIDKALTSGQIDAYPEYTGESAVTVAGINTTPKSPQQEYDLAKAFYAKRGQSMSAMTPFFDTDAIGVTKAYAAKYGLKTTADLKKIPHFTLGARPEFQGRQQGAVPGPRLRRGQRGGRVHHRPAAGQREVRSPHRPQERLRLPEHRPGHQHQEAQRARRPAVHEHHQPGQRAADHPGHHCHEQGGRD